MSTHSQTLTAMRVVCCWRCLCIHREAIRQIMPMNAPLPPRVDDYLPAILKVRAREGEGAKEGERQVAACGGEGEGDTHRRVCDGPRIAGRRRSRW